jgi:predicted  nucleic acid-binding Zn-ribbon protein
MSVFHEFHFQKLMDSYKKLNELFSTSNLSFDDTLKMLKELKNDISRAQAEIGSNNDPLFQLINLHGKKVEQLKSGFDLSKDEENLKKSKDEFYFAIRQKHKSIKHQDLLDELKVLNHEYNSERKKIQVKRKTKSLITNILVNLKKDSKMS